MKNVLLYYSFGFALGGGEYLPLAFIAALQKACNLTLAVDVEANIERSVKAFGTGLGIDLSRLRVVQVTPPNYDPRKHSVLVSLYRFRKLKRLARDADVCISTASIMDFGKPAHHFINMIAFGDDAFTAFALGNAGSYRLGAAKRARRFFSDSILRPLLGMRSKRSIICDSRQHIYPNSQYVAGMMAKYYGPFNGTVFFPPTLFEPKAAKDVVRDPLKVVYIGRIIQEKRITDLIGIVEKARTATGLPVTFHLAGRVYQSPSYGKALADMAREREWLKFVGALYGEEKERFLMSGSFALHAERHEAFGISVAEYLVSGNIAIVPDEGGSREVVDSPALSYRTDDEAASILSRLLTDAAFREEQRRHCAERAKTFTRQAYMERQQMLLDNILK